MKSTILSPRGIKALEKIGDVLIPGNVELPSFSQAGVTRHVDKALSGLTKDDQDGLKLILPLLGIFPRFILNFLMNFLAKQRDRDHALAPILRHLDIGLTGLIFSLYYSRLPENKKVFEVLNFYPDTPSYLAPATRSKLKRNLKRSELEEVYTRARKAQESFAHFPPQERITFIIALKEIILERREELIDRVQKETHKSRFDALTSEIFPLVDYLDWLVANGPKILMPKKVKTPAALMGKKSFILPSPSGIVLVISPWNYPLFQAIAPIAQAIAAGNAVIYKPSEVTPLEGIVEDLIAESGLNEDLVQIIYGDGTTGRELIDLHPDRIFFTGSVATGKAIMAQAAAKLIPCELELGGKDPMIVFDDVNIERAVSGAMWGAFTNSGQSCTSVEHLFVHENIYDNFKSRMVAKTNNLTFGIDADGSSDMGQMTSIKQKEIIISLVDDAIKKGAKLLTGKDWWESSRSGLFIAPMILEDVTKEMNIYHEEIFGPVIPLYKFSSEFEVIQICNQMKYGLSASVWTSNQERAIRLTKALQTGNVSINNVMLTEGNPNLPFGGVKESGIGRFKGEHGLLSMCQLKSVLVDSNSSKIEANWYPFTRDKYFLFSQMMDGLFGDGLKAFLRFAYYGLRLEILSNRLGKKM